MTTRVAPHYPWESHSVAPMKEEEKGKRANPRLEELEGGGARDRVWYGEPIVPFYGLLPRECSVERERKSGRQLLRRAWAKDATSLLFRAPFKGTLLVGAISPPLAGEVTRTLSVLLPSSSTLPPRPPRKSRRWRRYIF